MLYNIKAPKLLLKDIVVSLFCQVLFTSLRMNFQSRLINYIWKIVSYFQSASATTYIKEHLWYGGLRWVGLGQMEYYLTFR